MKLPRRQFLHLAAGAAALPAFARWRLGRDLSDAAGTHHRPGLPPGGAPDIVARLIGAMAVGAARPAVRHREPAGRRQQDRHRGRRALRHPTATRCCWSSPPNAINATLYKKLNYNFIRDIAPVAGISRVPLRDAGQSVGSGQDGPRVHRLRQGQSRQDQHGVGRHRHVAAYFRRAVQDDGRHRHAACPVSRRRARADRSASAARSR